MTEMLTPAPPVQTTAQALEGFRARARGWVADWTTDPAVRRLFRSKLFWLGLALKMAMGSVLASYYMRDLFTPFVSYFVESGFSNPWEHFAREGRLNSFPYPPVMLFVLAPARWLAEPFLPSGTDTVTFGHLFVMRIPLLLADIGVVLMLVRWFPHRLGRILGFYWWSPFTIYICYWHGQLDIIPTALFLLALYAMYHQHPMLAMVIAGLALASKHHLLVAFPFLLVYLKQERDLGYAIRGASAAALAYLLAVGPFYLDPSFRQMVFGTQEQARLVAFRLPVGSADLAIMLAPAAIILLWFRFAAYGKRNWDLLMLYLGMLFSIFILLAPPAPGYFLWSLPFLIHFICRARSTNALPYFAYTVAYLVFYWSSSQSDLLDAWQIAFPQAQTWPSPYDLLSQLDPNALGLMQSLTFTAMEATLAGLVLNMYLFGVRSNAVYEMRTAPVLIGLAGDSASGKDTFARLASRLLGESKVTVVSGDDYHRWPRGHEFWRVYTHLDVRANDLYKQLEHAVALWRGKSIVKGTYDHRTGQFLPDELFDPNEHIIFSGLHSLSIEGLRQMYDLKVFLDPDEDLRRSWKLRRDQQERGYSAGDVLQLNSEREADRRKYILPQRDEADLVVRFRPPRDIGAPDLAARPDLVLELRALNSFDLIPMVEGLRGLETLAVEHEPFTDARWQWLRIEGEVPGRALHAVASGLYPDLEKTCSPGAFAPGLQGCLQLVFLVCLTRKLEWQSEY